MALEDSLDEKKKNQITQTLDIGKYSYFTQHLQPQSSEEEKKRLIGMYAPDVHYAYEEMQRDLEESIEASLREREGWVLEKEEVEPDWWQERNKWEYVVKDKEGNIVAKVTYQRGMAQVVQIEYRTDGKLDDLAETIKKHFVEEFQEHFEEYRRRFERGPQYKQEVPPPEVLEEVA